MHSTFTWNGHSSDEFGIYIVKKPDLNRSARKFETASVSGRNGNIYQLQEAWEEVIVSYEIYAGGKENGEVITSFTDIVEWLNSADGYAVLTDSYDPDHYRMAVFVDALAIEQAWYSLGKTTIQFRCRPERYIVTNPLTPSSGGIIVNNTNHIAEPIITLTGSGARSILDLNKTLDTSHDGIYQNLSSLVSYADSKVWIAMSNNASMQPKLTIDSTKGSLTNITNTDGKIDFSISSTSQSWGIATIQKVDGNSDYMITCQGYDGGAIGALYVNNNNETMRYIEAFHPTYQTIWVDISMSIHTPAECGYIVFIFYRTALSHISTQNYKSIMLNRGTTALPFRPYSANISSSLTINNTKISFSGAFTEGEINCERENLKIDGVDSNSTSSVTDQYGNLSTEYLNLAKGNNSISFDGEIASVSVDPKFWEL